MAPRLAARNLVATILAALGTAVAGCQPADSPATQVTGSMTIRTGMDPLQAPSMVELENASYLGIAAEPITLSGGRWEGEPFVAGGAARPTIGLVPGVHVTGDLTGDGREEATVLLWSNSGGSGTYDYVAVMGRDADGTASNLGTAALGDRVQLRIAEVVNGRIVLQLLQAGSSDPACCPGQKWRRTFALLGADLVETASEDLGRMTMADLAGVEWQLTHFEVDESAPDDVEVTLVFDGERISGKSACNRYNGSVVTGALPGDLAVKEPMASTMMACPPPLDAIERRFQTTLQQVRRYSFQAGQLALHWRSEDAHGTMLFAARQLTE